MIMIFYVNFFIYYIVRIADISKYISKYIFLSIYLYVSHITLSNHFDLIFDVTCHVLFYKFGSFTWRSCLDQRFDSSRLLKSSVRWRSKFSFYQDTQ